jgi:hypothetical protein
LIRGAAGGIPLRLLIKPVAERVLPQRTNGDPLMTNTKADVELDFGTVI